MVGENQWSGTFDGVTVDACSHFASPQQHTSAAALAAKDLKIERRGVVTLKL